MAEQYLAPTSPGDHARTTNHHESPDETALSNDIDVDTTTTTATISEPLHELLDHFQATITAGLEARRLDFLSFENQATELMQQLQHEIGGLRQQRKVLEQEVERYRAQIAHFLASLESVGFRRNDHA